MTVGQTRIIPMDEMPTHDEFMDDVRELFSRPEYAQFLEADGETLKQFWVTNPEPVPWWKFWR